MSKTNESTIFKFIVVTIIGGFALWFLYTLIAGTGNGINMGFRGNYGGGYFYMGSGLSISPILLLLVKFLFVLFIVGLAGGIFVFIKNYLFTKEDIEKIKSSFSSNTEQEANEESVTCSACGKEIDVEWKACPYCGELMKKSTN
ncbi:MAG: zinc ribbon domain-containing protein [Bacillota bacterium]|nr:zinc ribbon domain-containing protein [Bacillota bacterium]